MRHLAASIPDSFRSILRNACVTGRETGIGLYSGYLHCLRGVSLCRVKVIPHLANATARTQLKCVLDLYVFAITASIRKAQLREDNDVGLYCSEYLRVCCIFEA